MRLFQIAEPTKPRWPATYILEDLSKGKTKTQIKEEKKKQKEKEKQKKAKKQQFANIEKEINNKEEYLLKLQESLCDEKIYSNPAESERVNKEIKEVESLIEELYAKWEELGEN